MRELIEIQPHGLNGILEYTDRDNEKKEHGLTIEYDHYSFIVYFTCADRNSHTVILRGPKHSTQRWSDGSAASTNSHLAHLGAQQVVLLKCWYQYRVLGARVGEVRLKCASGDMVKP